jgi:hypothetical protein
MTEDKVGIGTNTPTEILDVNGNAKANRIIATTGLQLMNNAGINKLLVSDATVNASWTSTNTIPGTISVTNELSGAITSPIPALANVWQFAGVTHTVALNGNQRVVMSLSLPLGVSFANTNLTTMDLDVGYQNISGTSVINASGSNYSDYSVNFPVAIRNPYSAHGTFRPPAGTYKIGAVIRCSTANYFTGNDFITGYYMIINE